MLHYGKIIQGKKVCLHTMLEKVRPLIDIKIRRKHTLESTYISTNET